MLQIFWRDVAATARLGSGSDQNIRMKKHPVRVFDKSTRLREHARRLAWLALFGVALSGAASAQTADETVSWTLAAQSPDSVKPGSKLVLSLHGAVLDGWHVYALTQLPGGPIPLRVTLDANEVATADGVPAGSPSTKSHDPSFNLDTQYYSKTFTVTAPVRINGHLAAGRQSIPVSVRYQTCTAQICHPPKTVHLSASINVKADG